jgi:ATP-binding cassette, subfamily B, multidrug efflux pump
MLIRLLRRALPPYTGFLAAVAVLQLVGVIATLYLPRLNGMIIDNGVARGDIDYIWRTGLVMLAVSCVAIVTAIAVARLGSRVAASVGRDVRAQVFTRVLSFSDREVIGFGAPTLITRAGNDVTQVQSVLSMLLMVVVQAPIMMVGGIIMALQEDAGLAWIMAVAVPLLAIAVGLVISRMVPWFRAMQDSVDRVNRILREQITGVRVVRAFVREQVERDRFEGANVTYTGAAVAVGKLMALAFPVVMVIFNLSNAAVLWFGAHRVEEGQVQVGGLIAFMQYLIQVLMAVMMTTMTAMMIPRAEVSSRRVVEVLETESTVVDPPEPQADHGAVCGGRVPRRHLRLPGCRGAGPVRRELRGPPGHDDGHHRLHRLGQVHAAEPHPPPARRHRGAVLVDGRDVRDARLEDVWSRIALVPQKPYLFSGTVASNLRYGNPVPPTRALWEALGIAQAEDFVRRHARWSGGAHRPGRHQRLRRSAPAPRHRSSARPRPDVYLFDDSFSALDVATDARLRMALDADGRRRP